MKCKVGTGKGFSGLMRYADKADAEFISASTGKSQKDFLRAVARLRESRPDCRVPVLHFSLSLPEKEYLKNEEWSTAIAKFKEEMGLSEHDFYGVRHTDTDHDHIHLIVSKIHPSGTLWKDSNSARRAMTACTKIESDMNLRQTKTLDEFRSETGQRRRPVKDKEMQMVARTGKTGDRRKDVIAAKIRAEREIIQQVEDKKKQNPRYIPTRGELKIIDAELIREERKKINEQKRIDGKNGIAGANRNEQPGVNRRTLPVHENRNIGIKKARSPIGTVKSWRRGEVVNFAIGGEKVLIQHEDRIELFTLNTEALDLAIKTAVRSGKIPLDAFGSKEFKQAIEARALALNVPVKGEATDKKLRELQQAIEAKAKIANDEYRRLLAQQQQQAQQPPRQTSASKMKWSPKP